MYNLVAEQPVLLTVILGLLAFACLYGWTREGRRWLAVTGLVLLALIPLVWFLAAFLVTSEEEIRDMISDMAAKIEANEHESVYTAVHPSRPDILERVQAELPNYEFSKAKVGGYNQIKLLPGSSPPEAVVDLTASVKVSMKSGVIQDQSAARKLRLFLRRTDDGWKVIDYAHRPVVGGPDGFSTGVGDWEQNFGRD